MVLHIENKMGTNLVAALILAAARSGDGGDFGEIWIAVGGGKRRG